MFSDGLYTSKRASCRSFGHFQARQFNVDDGFVDGAEKSRVLLGLSQTRASVCKVCVSVCRLELDSSHN